VGSYVPSWGLTAVSAEVMYLNKACYLCGVCLYNTCARFFEGLAFSSVELYFTNDLSMYML